jgi:hypothetical protein
MAQQIKTGKVSAKTVMGRRDFMDGMKDKRLGKPVRDQWESTVRGHVIDRQWSYERGRAFYCYLKSRGMEGMKIKDGPRVTYEAQVAFMEARREGWIR